jgi:hypothetical protein
VWTLQPHKNNYKIQLPFILVLFLLLSWTVGIQRILGATHIDKLIIRSHVIGCGMLQNVVQHCRKVFQEKNVVLWQLVCKTNHRKTLKASNFT